MKKRVEKLAAEVERVWTKSLSESNLKSHVQKITEELALINKGVGELKKNYRKKIKEYGKEIRSRCVVSEIGKYVRKLEKTERRLSRLRHEREKLGQLEKRFEEIMERLDRASDVITYLSSEKFLILLRRAMLEECRRREESMTPQIEEMRIPADRNMDRAADALQKIEEKSDESTIKEENHFFKEQTFIGCDELQVSVARSADVSTKILCTESEITCLREISHEDPCIESKNIAEHSKCFESDLAQTTDAEESMASSVVTARVMQCKYHLSTLGVERELKKNNIIHEREKKITSDRIRIPLRPFDPGGDGNTIVFSLVYSRGREM
jgi:hypothetical protein